MPDDTPKTLRADGVIEERTSEPRRLAGVIGWVGALCSLLPWTRDNAPGRRNHKQLRGLIIALGAVALWLGRRDPWLFAIGLLTIASAFVIPLREVQRRRLLQRLQRARTRTIVHEHDASLEHDGRRVMLRQGGELLRRVLTNRAFCMTPARFGGHEAFILRAPDAKKKREQIVIILRDTTHDATRSAEDSADAGRAPVALKRADVDAPIWLDSAAWTPLHDRLVATGRAR